MKQLVRPSLLLSLFFAICVISSFGQDDPAEVLATYRGGEVTRAELTKAVESIPASSWPKPQSRRIRAIAVMEYLDQNGEVDENDPVLEMKLRANRAALLTPFFTRELGETCVISGEELEKRFEENKQNFLKPEKRRIRHIFKKIEGLDEDGIETARIEMDTIRKKLVNGADFEATAREESESKTQLDGGLVGNVVRGQMPKEIESVVFSLAADDISPVVAFGNGLHLFLCENIIPQKTPTDEEIRTRIRNFYQQSTFRQKWEELQETWANQVKITTSAIASGSSDETALKITDELTLSGEEVRTLLPSIAANDQISENAVRGALRPFIVHSRAAAEYLANHEMPAEVTEAMEWRTRKFKADSAFEKRLAAAGEIREPEESELRELYESNKEELNKDTEYLVDSVTVRIEPASVVEDSDSLESLREVLAGDIEVGVVEAAQKMLSTATLERSQVTARTWRTKLGTRGGGRAAVDALLELAPGETSPVFRTSFGSPSLSLLRLHEISETRTLTFEESEPGLRKFLLNKRIEARRQQVETDLLDEMSYEVAN